jgi:uncharacterized protein YqgV (UPF0045/DUF77 family)
MSPEARGEGSAETGHRRTEIEVEFTIYPFDESDAPPPYVQAALEACLAEGIEPEFAVLSIKLRGEASRVLRAILTGAQGAIEAGATKIVLDIESVDA